MMGQRCLNYVVLTLDQKAITTSETTAPYEKVFVGNVERKIDDVILICKFLEFYVS